MVDNRRLEVPNLYRETTLGKSLDEVLTSLLEHHEISEDQRDAIFEAFDLQMYQKFSEIPLPQRPAKITGESISYNNYEDIWKFKMKNVEIRDESLREQS